MKVHITNVGAERRPIFVHCSDSETSMATVAVGERHEVDLAHCTSILFGTKRDEDAATIVDALITNEGDDRVTVHLADDRHEDIDLAPQITAQVSTFGWIEVVPWPGRDESADAESS